MRTLFFINKNTFGEFLMVSLMASMLSFAASNKIGNKIIFAIFSCFFLAFVFLSRSSTASLLSALIFATGVIFVVVDYEKLKWRYKIIIFVILAIFVGLLIASPYISFLSNTKIANFVKEMIDKVFAIKGRKFIELFTGRGKFWSFGVYIIRPNYIMMGYGEGMLEAIISSSGITSGTTKELTNAYLTVLDSFGIIGSLFYLAVICYLFYKYFHAQDDLSEWLLMFLLVFLMYGMFESLVLFESFSGSLAITPLLVVPSTYFVVEKKKPRKGKAKNEHNDGKIL